MSECVCDVFMGPLTDRQTDRLCLGSQRLSWGLQSLQWRKPVNFRAVSSHIDSMQCTYVTDVIWFCLDDFKQNPVIFMLYLFFNCIPIVSVGRVFNVKSSHCAA